MTLSLIGVEVERLWALLASPSSEGERGSPEALAGESLLHCLPADVLIHVLSYSDPKALCTVAATCRQAKEFVSRHERRLWDGHAEALRASFLRWPSFGSPRESFLFAQMRLAVAEAKNMECTGVAVNAIWRTQNGWGGTQWRRRVLGMAADVGFVDSARLSLALSMRRNFALHSILVRDCASSTAVSRCLEAPRPLSFLSLEQVALIFGAQGPRPAYGPAPGLLGYADELVRLLPEHEEYRPCFRAVFRNMLVFETRGHAEALAASRGASLEELEREQFICCLDHPSLRGKDLDDCSPHFAVGRPRILDRGVRPALYLERAKAFHERCQTSLAHVRYA